MLIISAFFAGAEIALVSIDRVTLRKLSRQHTKETEAIVKLKKKPRRMITTILIGNNLTNILLSSFATAMAIEYFGSVGIGIAIGATIFFVLIFGEIFPKSYAEANNVQIALFSAPMIQFLSVLFHPIILLFELIPIFFYRYIFKTKPKKYTTTEEDIIALAEIGVEENSIQLREKETIERILRFNDVSVKQVMVPKKDIVCLSANSTISNALEIIDAHGHSRYPVYEGRRSNIIGIVHVKEILRTLKDNDKKTRIRNLTINTLNVPINETIDHTFKKLQKSHVHMALVVNEKGVIKGIVTFEDLIEEIFGEIEDEEELVRSFKLRRI